MKVMQILTRKGTNDVSSIPPSASLADAAKRLCELKVGCLVVRDGAGPMVGILSERDIVRTLGVQGPECLKQRVESVMTRSVVTCNSEDSADDVLGRMTTGRFRHMPVLDGESLTGLISIGDVVKARIDALEQDYEALESMIRSATA